MNTWTESPGVCINVTMSPKQVIYFMHMLWPESKTNICKGTGRVLYSKYQDPGQWHFTGLADSWAHSWLSQFGADIRAEQRSYCVTVPTQTTQAKATRITWPGSKGTSIKRKPVLRSLWHQPQWLSSVTSAHQQNMGVQGRKWCGCWIDLSTRKDPFDEGSG